VNYRSRLSERGLVRFEVLGLTADRGLIRSLARRLVEDRPTDAITRTVRSGSDTVEPIPSYGDLETIGYGKDNVVMRKAAATTPLRAMPLVVLAHARPFELPREVEGFSSDALESILRTANEDLATLVPNARFFVAKDSGHDIHQDQPELVIEAMAGEIPDSHRWDSSPKIRFAPDSLLEGAGFELPVSGF